MQTKPRSLKKRPSPSRLRWRHPHLVGKIILNIKPVVRSSFTGSLRLSAICRTEQQLTFLPLLSTRATQRNVQLTLPKTCGILRLTNLYSFSLMVSTGCLSQLRLRAYFQTLIIASDVLFYSSLEASAKFKQCIPFVNPANVSPDQLSVGDYKHIIWSGSKQNAIFTMLGAVTSCSIINSTTIGNNRYRALTIIPYGPSFDGFTNFLGNKYTCTDMFGPFEYGCLLTFSSRREGLSSACLSANCFIECINDLFYRWVCASKSEY